MVPLSNHGTTENIFEDFDLKVKASIWQSQGHSLALTVLYVPYSPRAKLEILPYIHVVLMPSLTLSRRVRNLSLEGLVTCCLSPLSLSL